VALMATAAVAVPIVLPVGQVTKIKYTNFENLVDANKSGFVDAGDYVEGILFGTSVGTIPVPNLLNAQLGSKEITGYFRLTIVAGSLTGSFPQQLDFGLIGPNDKLELYVGTGATKNWTAGSGVATDIANATDGALWMAIYPNSGWYEGVGKAASSSSGDTVNTNFGNLGVNNSGYFFQPQFFFPLTGDPTAHTYLTVFHADHMVETMFKSRLFNPSLAAGWAFRSEDPMYFWAIPEPGTIVLLGAGIAGLGLLRLRRRRS
jgi:hypothetical protein